MKKRLLGGILLFLGVILALGVLFSALPYYGQFYYSYLDDPHSKKVQRIENYIRTYRNEVESTLPWPEGKACNTYNNIHANLLARWPATLPYIVADTRLGVRGELVDKEYIYVQVLPSGRKITTVAKESTTLPGVSYLQYTLQVDQCFIGSVGWQREIVVQISGDELTGAPAQLELGEEVVLLLTTSETSYTKEACYYSVKHEHGIFTLDAQDRVYAFSDMAGASSYDGKSARKLIRDIQKMRRDMGLWG